MKTADEAERLSWANRSPCIAGSCSQHLRVRLWVDHCERFLLMVLAPPVGSYLDDGAARDELRQHIAQEPTDNHVASKSLDGAANAPGAPHQTHAAHPLSRRVVERSQ